MDYFPLNFSQITNINSVNLPSTIKQRNNRAYGFWCRALFERAMSVFEWKVPESWLGPQIELMKYVLARNGFGLIAYDESYDYFFQPCNVSGFGFFYQPVKAILSNPALRKEYEIGKTCEIVRMTHDYMGIWDIIDYFAVKLSQIDTSINTALVNSKNAWMLFASSKGAGLALKKAKDLIDQGEPAVVFDSRALVKQDAVDASKEPIIKIDLGALENAQIVGIQLQDLQTILTMFDTEIGIVTVGGNQAKKERLTEFESESKCFESQARCSMWLSELQDSFTRVKNLFPELDIWVELRKDFDCLTGDEEINDKEEEVTENADD